MSMEDVQEAKGFVAEKIYDLTWNPKGFDLLPHLLR